MDQEIGMTIDELDYVLKHFKIHGIVENVDSFGNGLINKTIKLSIFDGFETEDYILQKINANVFNNISGLMTNIERVTSHIKLKAAKSGKNPKRETLTIIKTQDGKNFFELGDSFYRMYACIENSISYDKPRSKEAVFLTGQSFGNFHKQLSDLDPMLLIDTIPNFHNTVKRLDSFFEFVKNDEYNRAKSAIDEINFVAKHSYVAHLIDDKLKNDLPIKATHNDPKFNNILFDKVTGNPLAIIDLDTVMPGPIAYDFGDAVRSACNRSTESSKNLSEVGIDLNMFEAFTSGYLSSMGNTITKQEVDSLVDGCETITFELGIRFLTDYLSGDTYFKTTYPKQNLDRTRVQFALLESMIESREKMDKIVESYSTAEIESNKE